MCTVKIYLFYTYLSFCHAFLQQRNPKKYTSFMQIDVKADLSVGDNLLDHLKSDMGLFGLPGPDSLAPQRVNAWGERVKYTLFGTGASFFFILHISS